MFGNDVDLFVLLLAHNENINCSELFMKTLTGYTSIASIHQFLGNYAASALLPFHALTGCNITGMFSGKRKEFGRRSFFLKGIISISSKTCSICSKRCGHCRIIQVLLSVVLFKENPKKSNGKFG